MIFKKIKKIPFVALVGFSLTIICVALYIRHPFFVQAISNYTYDAFIRASALDEKSNSIVIIDLDDRSIHSVAQWPWPRFLMATLTDKLIKAGASVVAFDIVFAEKDRTSPIQVQEIIKKYFGKQIKFSGIPEELLNFDGLFANSLKAGKTVLGFCLYPIDRPPQDLNKIPSLKLDNFDTGSAVCKALHGTSDKVGKFLRQANGATISIPELGSTAKHAFFNAVPDFDGVIRSSPLIWGSGPEKFFLSLALQALSLHVGKPCIIKYDIDGVREIQIGDIKIPTDPLGGVIINYRKIQFEREAGFSGVFPTISAVDILEDRFDPDYLRGKIIFIGASAVGLKDIRTTPMSQFFSGVEVHATIVDNILAGDVLRKPPYEQAFQSFAIVLIGLLMTLLIARGRSWLSFLLSVLLILILIKGSLYALNTWQFVFVPGWLILSVVIIYPVLTMIKFWQEEIQKKQIRNMFGTMVSSSVLHYLENHPESFSLSGQKAEATMFFADIAGFTTISESLEPARLSELLNRYLSPMTEIIMKRGGYVDKYEGDLIMAEWGVPYPMADHAVQACYAAIEQQIKLNEIRPVLKNEFGYEINVRMGLNSGVVTAGNMGSQNRFQYTVMGDAVNLAARLEPINKDYGTSIIIGENTRSLVHEIFLTRMLDKIIVKGKTVPIKIYELVSLKEKTSSDIIEIINLYEKALQLHWERKWDDAIELLEKALSINNFDSPCLTLKQRILYYKQNPPSPGWVGEYVRQSKD